VVVIADGGCFKGLIEEKEALVVFIFLLMKFFLFAVIRVLLSSFWLTKNIFKCHFGLFFSISSVAA